MGGKYSAEWWGKIADMTREMGARQGPSHIVDDLIQATATGKAPARSHTRGAEFANASPSRVLHAE